MMSAEDKPPPTSTPPPAPKPSRPPTSERGVTLRAISFLILPMLALLWWTVSPAVTNSTGQDWFAVFAGLFLFLCFLIPFFWVALIRAAMRRRSTHQEGLLWMMAIAAKRGLPLGPGVQAYMGYCGEGVFFALISVFLGLPLLGAGILLWVNQNFAPAAFLIVFWGICEIFAVITMFSGSWGFRRKLQRLADLLNNGEDLYNAGIGSRGALNRADMLFLRAGASSDRLASALQQAIAFRRQSENWRRVIGFRVFYMAILVHVITAVISVNAYFIVPKFRVIANDFGFESLPKVTELAFQIAETAGPWLFLALFFSVIWLGLSGLRLQVPFLPLADRIFPHVDNALALRGAALGTESGLPAKAIFIQLIEAHPKRWIRRRLDRVYDALDRGSDLTAALRKAKLIRSADVHLLNAAIRAGNVSWALRQLAEAWERRWSRMAHWMADVLFPLAIVALGLVVLGFCAAMFAPLATMIEGLSSW